MVEGTVKLVVDLGNSETRVSTIFGKTRTGKPRSRTSVLSNKFGELLNEDLLSNEDYTGENSKVFVVGRDSLYCSGEMCDKEKGSAAMRPSTSLKKYSSDISKLSLNMAFLQGYQDISEMFQNEDDFNIIWDVAVMLPPSDMDVGQEAIIQMVKDITELNFKLPDFHTKVAVNSVNVYPEGFCAFIGTVFENPTKIRKGFNGLLKSSTLVVDIGAGTTDLCIIQDCKLIDNSRYTEETGGNQVFQKVNRDLRKRFARNFSEDSLREASVTGSIKIGAKVVDISDIINDAKKDVVVKLSSSIKNYLESSDVSIYGIENILVCGGGACEDESGLRSLGSYLKDELSIWMEYSNFIGDVFDDKGEVLSPRLLNILGASILSSR